MKKTWIMVTVLAIGLGLVSCKDKTNVNNGCVCTLTDPLTEEVLDVVPLTLEEMKANGINDCATLQVSNNWASNLDVSCSPR